MTTGLIIGMALVGIILLVFEFFVTPGFGISGILGIAALIWAIVAVSDSLLEGVIYVFGLILLIALLTYLSFRSPETNVIWKRLALWSKQTNQEGYVAPKQNFERYVGLQGVAITPLRPAGTADFSGERLDVVTEGDFIKKGSHIKVMAVEGGRIIVREISGQG